MVVLERNSADIKYLWEVDMSHSLTYYNIIVLCILNHIY